MQYSAKVALVEVTDLTHPDLADYTQLTDVALRKKLDVERGLYIAESPTVIRRAVAAGHIPRSLLLAPAWLDSLKDIVQTLGAQGVDVPLYVAPEAELEKITGFHLHRGALAAMHRPLLPTLPQVLAQAKRVAILENIVDHTNVGAIFRAAAGIGIDAVLVTPRCADPLYRRSVRVSMGTVFAVNWTRIDPWPSSTALLRDLGFVIAGLALEQDSLPLDELSAQLPEKLALVLGTEGDGLAPATIAACDLSVKIPMAGGVDSLNVASAAAVAFWATR